MLNYITEILLIDDKEYLIYIGKNAHGNEEIIKKCHPESLWFHFDNISSAHIILESNGDDIPKRYINQVASKLFEHKRSAPRNSKVIYTQVKNVKLTNTLGTVIPKNTKTIKF